MQPRTLFLFSPVTSASAEYLIRQLLELDRESSAEITLFINSPGGLVNELFAIIDTMNTIASPVRTVVMGTAASAAAVIAAAGKTRLITENSQFMLHEVFGFVMGTMSQIDEDSKRIEKMQNKLLNILAKATKKTSDELRSYMKNKDRYLDAKAAVAFGLTDKIIQANEAQVLKLSEGINAEGYEINAELREVQLLKTGRFFHPEYGHVLINKESLETMVKNFETKVRGIDLSLDYTHDSENGERPAAAWIKKLEVRSDMRGSQLFAHVEFTPKGLEMVSAKEYKYASADFCIDYLTEEGKHVPYVLRGGTLTNRPFIKEMNPIKLSEYKPNKNQEIENMDKEALIAALKNAGVDVTALQADLTSSQARITELENQIRDLSALPATKDTEINELKNKLSEANKKIVDSDKLKTFEGLVSSGKVVPAQKDSIFKQFNSAEDMAAFYKDAPVVTKMKANGSENEGTEDTLSEAEQALVSAGTYTKEEIIAGRKPSYGKKKKS